MDQKTEHDSIMIVNADGLVMGANAACAALLRTDLTALTEVCFSQLGFSLTLTELLACYKKVKNNNRCHFKTDFLMNESEPLSLVITAEYVDSLEVMILRLETDETAAGVFDHPEPLLTQNLPTAINLSLGEVLDVSLLQKIMDAFYELTGILVAILDMDGKIIVQNGWQDICLNFHRVNPAACKNCLESDYEITNGIKMGEYRAYKCKNNLWDVATPIYIENQRMGHLYLGQFFYDDEPIDYEYFRRQAKVFDFDETAYLEALSRVPRYTHHQVETAMDFYSRMAGYISQLSYTNIKIRETMDELYRMTRFQTALMDAVPSPIFYKNKELVYLGGNKAFERATGLSPGTYVGKTASDLFTAELAAVYNQTDADLLVQKKPQTYEFEVRNAAGEKKDVIFNKAIFPDLNGEPAGIIGVIQDITDRKQAEQRLLKANEEIIETQKELIYTLGQIIENRSKETAKHVVRVAEYSYLIGLKYGLDPEEALLLKIAAPMHDIGKIGIPDHILNKPGALTPEEFDCIKTHTTIGHRILKKSQHKIMKMAGIIALSHHERWDGTGYPQGLAGDRINIYSRIVSIADVFDAISHKRCYKEAWDLEESKNYLIAQSGIMFDPRLIDLFLENWAEILTIRAQNSDS